MKIYIASKYIEHKKINKEIFDRLSNDNIDAFLPETINIEAVTKEEMFTVSEKCFNEIESCDVILIVAPFGKSVSTEIGYAIYQKRLGYNKKLILFKHDKMDEVMKTEAMIAPYIDVVVEDIDELISYLINKI